MQFAKSIPHRGLLFHPETAQPRDPLNFSWKMAQSVIGKAMSGAHDVVTKPEGVPSQTISSAMATVHRNLGSPQEAAPTLAQILGKARFDAFSAVSQVSMLLEPGWREQLFADLNYLLNPETWDPEDVPLQVASFGYFLAAMIDIKPTRCPSLGLTYSGHVVAGWHTDESQRIAMEFAPNKKVTVIGTRLVHGEAVAFSARTSVGVLKQTLEEFMYMDMINGG